MTKLSADHTAVQNQTTLFQKSVFDPANYPYKFIKKDTGAKLG